MKTKAKYVYVQSTNCIGILIDEGTDQYGKWYRTDCDGVRDPNELLFLYTKTDVKRCIKQLKASIAPSTRKLIGI